MDDIRPHIVSLSGGTASAVAANRVIERFGLDNVVLWFADTLWEDEDLYRFLDDCSKRWGIEITVSTEGRTPLQVAEDRQIIPNSRIAPCSSVLKQLQFKKFLNDAPKPVTVHLGLDWAEEHRMARPKAEYEAVPGVTVDFPLTWLPLPNLRYYSTVQEWGIKPPRLYDLGFPHNNCGGRCVRQGIKEWIRLKYAFPERFAEVRDWEQAQRAKGGPRATYAIAKDRSDKQVRPLTLAEIEEREDDVGKGQLFEGDAFGCFCEY